VTAACSLAFRRGPGQRLTALRLAAATELGAAPPLTLVGQGVTPRHARLAPEGTHWTVAPLEGAVRVNGIPLSAGPRTLRSGDVLALGEATLTFFEETEPVANGKDGNGFARASRLIARALDGLGPADADLLRQLAELEGALENAPLAAASQKMNAGSFAAALEILDVASCQQPWQEQIRIAQAVCLAKVERFEDADLALNLLSVQTMDPQVRKQALDLRRQVTSARLQKEHAPVLEAATKALQSENYFEATAAFNRLPDAVRNEPPIKLMAALARVKLVLSMPVTPQSREGVRLFLSQSLDDVGDVVRRTEDPSVREQALSLQGQIQKLLRQV